ncbi:MAG: hypothetical protein ACKVOK_16855 [Flavobacteriales bacterium]
MQFAAILSLLLALSCRHDPEIVIDPCPGGYPLIFGFVNQGDTTVTLIDLESKCYRANVDSSNIFYRQYESLEFDPDDRFPLQDSIIHKQFPCATPSSFKWMWVKIVQREQDGSTIRITNWELDTANWVYMYEPEDFTEIFHWPEDTLRYIKTYDWRPE